MKIILTTLLVSILFFSCTKTGPQGPAGPAGTNGTNGTNAIQSTQIFTVASTAWRNDGGDGRVALYDNQITGSTNALTYLSTDSVKWQNYGGTYEADSVIIYYPIPTYTTYFKVVILN